MIGGQSMTEREMTRTCRDYLKALGNKILWFRDEQSYLNRAGFPDFIVILDYDSVIDTDLPTCLLIELKTPRGKLTEKQRQNKEWIDEHGIGVEWHTIYSIEDFVDLFVDRIRNAPRLI